MREILKTLSHLRSQKLEVCYNTVECESPFNKALAHDPDIAADALQDKCQKNQMMYGHGVTPNFAEYLRENDIK